MIVEEAPASSRPEGLPSRPCHILTLSARTESAVKNLASRFEKHLAEHPEDDLRDICFTANAGRSHFARRVAVVVESKEQLREALAAFAAGQPAQNANGGSCAPGTPREKTARASPSCLARRIRMPAPRSSFTEPNPFFARPWIAARVFWACTRMNRCSPRSPRSKTTRNAATRRYLPWNSRWRKLWRSWGIEPDAVLGAGVGEYAAAVISGVLSCEDALKLIVERARLLRLALQDGELTRMLDEFEATAASMKFEMPSVPFVSGLSGQLLAEGEIPGASYWRLQVLQAMQQEEGIETLAALGYDHFLEVGPPSSFSASKQLSDPRKRRPRFFLRSKRSRRVAKHAHEPGLLVCPRRQRRLEGLR